MFLANKLNKGAGTPVVLDAQFNYVTMLLHGDGTNGAQNNTFLDSSTNNFTITRNGNTTQGSFSPYGSNWSNAFDGTSDYIETPSSSAFAFGTGAYTIEGWIFINVMPSSGNIYQVFNFTDDKENLSINSSGTLNYYNGTTGTSSTATVSVGTWTHIAYTRSSTTIKAYINNTEVISASSSGNYTSNRIFVIGARAAATKGANCLNGYLSNVRVLKGTALTTFDLTTNLTAITNTVLLTCQSNRFVDNSSSPLTLTAAGNTSVQRFNPFGASTAYSTSVIGGSGYFDGSGDYLVTSGTGSFNPRSTFTVEFWTYPISNNTVTWINSNTNNNFYFETSGTTLFVGDGIINTIGTSAPTVNQWTHMLLSFDGTTYRLFYNGGLQASSTSLLQSNVITAFRIGQKQEGTRPFNGYITDMRVLVGTALYTSAFTPPTAPLTAITNTALLTKFQNGAIFDNAMMNDLETVGNAQISTSVKKYGTGSLAFDGTGDYLTGKSNPIYAIGTANFTVEAWVYPTAFSAYRAVFDTRTTLSNGGMDLGLASSSAGVWGLYKGSAVTVVQSSTNLTLNTWQHIAAVRSGSTVTLYLDGVSVGSATDAQDFTEQGCHVGRTFDNYTWSGYIDDLRVTRGYARYTTTFTPPTAAFPNTGPY